MANKGHSIVYFRRRADGSKSGAYIADPRGVEELDYDAERRRWAASLTLNELKAIAADYYPGTTDEAAVDAMTELMRRGKAPAASPSSVPKAQRARCPQHSRGRRPIWCLNCDTAEQARLELVNAEGQESPASPDMIDDPNEAVQAIQTHLKTALGLLQA